MSPRPAFLLAAALVLLAACVAPPRPAPQIVEVPVPVACITELPTPPVLATDAELKAQDRYQRTLRLWLDRQKLLDHKARLEAILEACRAIAR
jgi:hypothetical protein